VHADSGEVGMAGDALALALREPTLGFVVAKAP